MRQFLACLATSLRPRTPLYQAVPQTGHVQGPSSRHSSNLVLHQATTQNQERAETPWRHAAYSTRRQPPGPDALEMNKESGPNNQHLTFISPWQRRRGDQQHDQENDEQISLPGAVPITTRQIASKPIHRLYTLDTKAKALVTFIETRNRIPGPIAVKTITQYLKLQDGYSLPWILLQLMVRSQKHKASSIVSKHLVSDDIWEECLRLRAVQGITLFHFNVWAHILQHKEWDGRVERFIDATHVPRPHFLLNILIHPNSRIWSRDSLVGLISHVTITYCQPKPDGDAEASVLVESADNNSADNSNADTTLDLAPAYFMQILRNLVNHCLRIAPDLLHDVANMAADYIRNMASPQHPEQLFALQCRMFNTVLDNLSAPPSQSTLRHRPVQWHAQRVLLEMSQERTRPLLLGKLGLTAIRKVLLGLGKSNREIRLAMRSKSTWPPYIKPQDGIDERTAPEDLVGRASAAGIASRAAGFDDTKFDEALDILAGGAPSSLPTIQTRTLPPHHRYIEEDEFVRRLGEVPSPLTQPRTRISLQKDIAWAARVRTARSTREAWAEFQRPDIAGERPRIAVYTQLLKKYLAAEPGIEDDLLDYPPSASTTATATATTTKTASGSSPWANKVLLPGDHPGVVFPPDISELSEYELARTEPPSVPELFEMMRESGLTAGLLCACTLVELSESFDQAFYYLRESGSAFFQMDSLTLYQVISSMLESDPNRPNDTFSLAYHDHAKKIRKIPASLFLSFIRLACNLQSSHRAGLYPGMAEALPAMRYIHIAIQLVRLRQGFSITGNDETRACWHVVLLRLSRSEIFISPQPMPYKAIGNLRLFLRSWNIFSASYPIDPRKFTFLAKVVENVGRAFLTHRPLYHQRHLIWRSCRTLNSAFTLLVSRQEKSGAGAGRRDEDTAYMLAGGGAIHHYMRAMGFLGGQEMHMAYVVYQVLTNNLSEPIYAFWTLCAFRAFAEPILLHSSDGQQRLVVEKLQELSRKPNRAVDLTWPSDEDLADYIFSGPGTQSTASLARTTQIAGGICWWKDASNQRHEDEDGRYFRRHRPLRDAVEDLVWWKKEIREELQSKAGSTSDGNERMPIVLREVYWSQPELDSLLHHDPLRTLEPEEGGKDKDGRVGGQDSEKEKFHMLNPTYSRLLYKKRVQSPVRRIEK